MALFLGERRLPAADFWQLTLPEINAVLAPQEDGAASPRAVLMRLMEAFPDD